MDRHSLRPIFLRAAALFLALWCLMAGVLTYLNYQRHREIIRSTVEEAVLLSASRWAREPPDRAEEMSTLALSA